MINNTLKNIKYYVRIHKQLHGTSANIDDIVKDYINSFEDNTPYETIYKITQNEFNRKNSAQKYGIFIGRCMPFHNGHNSIIQEIIRDGKKPIFILGSTNKKDERNPLSFDDRKYIISKVYDADFIGADDFDNWDEWYKNIETLILQKYNKEDITFYFHNKPEDKTNFEFNGKEYLEEYFSNIFVDEGWDIKYLDGFYCSLGFKIHATDIRNNEDIAIQNLDARVYITLKNEYGWWLNK